jgi:hypothetical protein
MVSGLGADAEAEADRTVRLAADEALLPVARIIDDAICEAKIGFSRQSFCEKSPGDAVFVHSRREFYSERRHPYEEPLVGGPVVVICSAKLHWRVL